jgi:hypothetical protein
MTTAYRGYLIQETRHGFAISKDGFHIGWSESLDGAKQTINSLLD